MTIATGIGMFAARISERSRRNARWLHQDADAPGL
jgi:hypothetical protein